MIVTIDHNHLELHFNRACEALSKFDGEREELKKKHEENKRLCELDAAKQSWVSKLFFGDYSMLHTDYNFFYRLHIGQINDREKSLQAYVRHLSDMMGSSLEIYTFDMRDL